MLSLSLSSWLWWGMIVPVYISWRMYAAARLPITDCDEVYNYWEPLHFVLFGDGSMQTWEYAHEYALRTYAYLLPLRFIAQYILQPLLLLLKPVPEDKTSASAVAAVVNLLFDYEVTSDKVVLFVAMRALLAALTATAELFWLFALAFPTRTRNGSPKCSNITVTAFTGIVLLTATGMNHAAGAYLPSSTWMAAWCLATAAFCNEQHVFFVGVCIVATLCTGWPFGAVSVIPMACHILYKEHHVFGTFRRLVAVIVLMTLLVQAIVMAVDYQYYGIWTSPTLNIFMYNAGNSGDELYGIEPVSYYIKNLLLNLNVAAVLGAMALPIYLLLPSLNKAAAPPLNWNTVSMLLCVPAWFAVTVPRPHKEERFLFPVYPILIFGAVLTIDTVITRLLVPLLRPKPMSQQQAKSQQLLRVCLHTIVWLPVILLSLSRTAALYKYYTAPLAIYNELSKQPQPSREPFLACICGEWYRFQSSFFLPQFSYASSVQLGFLPSSFTGQLPQPFSKHGSRKESQSVLQPFNDRNLEQKERYVQDITHCRWIVDLADGNCGANFNGKMLVATYPFLDGERTSTLHRTLYLPYFHEKALHRGSVKYQHYVLYKVDHTI